MSERHLLCPACQTPLPASHEGALVVTCPACETDVDVARLNTVVGKPRFVPERLWTGAKIDAFIVEELLGTGGMGTVYRARDAAGLPVAIKFMAPSLAAHSESVARFHREIALLSKLDHPGIVKIVNHGESVGIPWFAMELVEGPTLAQRLSKSPLTLDETRNLFEKLLIALSHAHTRGIVHRDLKPGNVLIAATGPKLADFGIAHLDIALASRATQLTNTHGVLGTYPYMSPEQRAGRPLDARSDLYSIGIMFYEAIAGERPEGAFASLHSRDANVPVEVDRWLLRLLQPDRNARVASADEAARLLRQAVSGKRARNTRAALGLAAACLTVGSVIFGLSHRAPLAPATSLKASAFAITSTGKLPAIEKPASASALAATLAATAGLTGNTLTVVTKPAIGSDSVQGKAVKAKQGAPSLKTTPRLQTKPDKSITNDFQSAQQSAPPIAKPNVNDVTQSQLLSEATKDTNDGAPSKAKQRSQGKSEQLGSDDLAPPQEKSVQASKSKARYAPRVPMSPGAK